MIHRRMADYESRAEIFAVNPGGKDVLGWPGFQSCREIPTPPDLAIILVPAQSAAQALEDAADAGIDSAVVLASGFAEAGEEGRALQAELVATARRRGVIFFGPNSLGFVNLSAGVAATAVGTRTPVRRGGVAVISQSGAVANEISKFAHQQGIGLSFLCATGNEAMIGPADVMDYLVDDPSTKIIVAYIEAVSDADRLRAVALRALAARKAVIMLKVGSSAMSAEVAKAHTGSLVGNDSVFDAACLQAGIIRVRSIEEMLVTAALIEAIGPIERPGIALASISGGGCGMFADIAEGAGVPTPQFSEDTRRRLAEVLPSYAASLNPLDLTGAAVQDPTLWSRVLPILFEDPNIGLVVSLVAMPGAESEMATCRAHWPIIAKAYRDAGRRPLLMSQVIQPMDQWAQAVADESGLRDILFSMDFGTRALGHLARWSQRLERGAAAARYSPPAGALVSIASEQDALKYLSTHGVPVIPAQIARNAEDAGKFACEIGGTIAMKIVSPDVAHKTEVGGVKLNLKPDDCIEAYEAICASVAAAAPDARIEGVVVSPMRAQGLELFVGIVRDPDWGLAIAVGLGGVWIEVLKDSALRLLPIDRDEAKAMLLSLKGVKLLQGYRGSAVVDLDKLADVIVSIGEAAEALGPNLAALEVNPLWVHGEAVEALDALVVWDHKA